MIGFYSIRKLIEAKKLSGSTIARRVPITTYPARGKPIHLLNWDEVAKLYDLENGNPAEIDLLSLCHQFVHSYVFVPELEGDGLRGFFIASDRQRYESVQFIDVDAVISLFKLVGNDFPAQSSLEFDARRGDYRISNL